MIRIKRICCQYCLLSASALLLLLAVLARTANAESILDATMTVDDARHLLVRTGVGASPSELHSLLGMTRSQAIAQIMAGMQTRPYLPMPHWASLPLPHYHARPDLDEEQRRQFNRDRDAELSELRNWWISNLLQTDSPQTERLVLFWHDLFATDYRGTGRQSLAMARQNQTFREHGFGSWELLLKKMIRDPALMSYLDADSNHKNSPNENLGRELLELFVLGEGNYDEFTVREAARSLTGHSVSKTSNLRFRLKTWAQDRGEKTLFGKTAPFDGDALVERLLEQPEAARFLTARFWHALVADDDPPAHWVDSVAKQFRESGHDVASLYRSVLESDEFWANTYRGRMIKSPIDLMVGTARSLDFPKSQWQNMARWQSSLGMNLFSPPSVAGWSEGEAFVTTGRYHQRLKLVNSLIRRSLKSKKPDGAGDIKMDGSPVPMMSERNEQSPLEIMLAAEDFQGPVHFSVQLLNGQNVLWHSGTLIFDDGLDTEQFGRLDNAAEVDWFRKTFEIDEALLAQAQRVRVDYLNDAAGAAGDRNLYVKGVRIRGDWLPASSASQRSGCPPAMQADAGNLYCQGFLLFKVRERKAAYPQLPQWRASAAHASWVKWNRQKELQQIKIVLDHLHTPAGKYHNVQFGLTARRDKPVMLELDSFDCWPDCVQKWPQHAWVNPHFIDDKRIALPWAELNHPLWSQSHFYLSQFNDLSEDEKLLVSSLWVSAPELLEQLRQTRRGQQHSEFLQTLQHRLKQDNVVLKKTPFSQRASSIVVDQRYLPEQQALQTWVEPPIKTVDLRGLALDLNTGNLSLIKLLLPSTVVEESAFVQSASKTGNHQEITLKRQLFSIIDHPAFQIK